MRLNQLSDSSGSTKARKRVGRGIGSGKGKTSGRGHKGQKSRSGGKLPPGFEGGQMPLYRRLPKRGFTNQFKKGFSIINVGAIQKALDKGIIDTKSTITPKILLDAGIVKRSRNGVRLLAKGEILNSVDINVDGASKAAIAAVESAGGKVLITEPKSKPIGKGKARHRKQEARRIELAKALDNEDV